MRNFNITLVLCATVGLGLLLGCATEYPGNVPVSQGFDSVERQTLSEVTLETPSTAITQSVVTLRKGEDLAEVVVKAPGVVLLDFHAAWCGPCVKHGKVLQGLADYASQQNASIIKVDIDQHEELATLFEVSALPCLLYTSPSPRDQRGTRMPSSA